MVKKLLAVMTVLLTAPTFAAGATYLEVFYDKCDLSLQGSKRKVKTHHRRSLCMLSPQLNVCFTKGGGTINRTYLPGKVGVTKVSGVDHVFLKDGVNMFFFKKHPYTLSILISKFDFNGKQAKLFCRGQWRKPGKVEFEKELRKWVKEKQAKSNKNAGRTI